MIIRRFMEQNSEEMIRAVHDVCVLRSIVGGKKLLTPTS